MFGNNNLAWAQEEMAQQQVDPQVILEKQQEMQQMRNYLDFEVFNAQCPPSIVRGSKHHQSWVFARLKTLLCYSARIISLKLELDGGQSFNGQPEFFEYLLAKAQSLFDLADRSRDYSRHNIYLALWDDLHYLAQETVCNEPKLIHGYVQIHKTLASFGMIPEIALGNSQISTANNNMDSPSATAQAMQAVEHVADNSVQPPVANNWQFVNYKQMLEYQTQAQQPFVVIGTVQANFPANSIAGNQGLPAEYWTQVGYTQVVQPSVTVIPVAQTIIEPPQPQAIVDAPVDVVAEQQPQTQPPAPVEQQQQQAPAASQLVMEQPQIVITTQAITDYGSSPEPLMATSKTPEVHPLVAEPEVAKQAPVAEKLEEQQEQEELWEQFIPVVEAVWQQPKGVPMPKKTKQPGITLSSKKENLHKIEQLERAKMVAEIASAPLHKVETPEIDAEVKSPVVAHDSRKKKNKAANKSQNKSPKVANTKESDQEIELLLEKAIREVASSKQDTQKDQPRAQLQDQLLEQLQSAMDNLDYAAWNKVIEASDLSKPFVIIIDTEMGSLAMKTAPILMNRFNVMKKNLQNGQAQDEKKFIDFIAMAKIKHMFLDSFISTEVEGLTVKYKLVALEALFQDPETFDFYVCSRTGRLFDLLAAIKTGDTQPETEAKKAYYKALGLRIVNALRRNAVWINEQITDMIQRLSAMDSISAEDKKYFNMLSAVSNELGQTPLMLALKYCHDHKDAKHGCLKYLLEICTFDSKDKEGNTELHYWAKYFMPDTSLALIKPYIQKFAARASATEDGIVSALNLHSQTFLHYLAEKIQNDNLLCDVLTEFNHKELASQVVACILCPDRDKVTVMHLLDSSKVDFEKTTKAMQILVLIRLPEFVAKVNAIPAEFENYRFFYNLDHDPLVGHVVNKDYGRVLKIVERRKKFLAQVLGFCRSRKISSTYLPPIFGNIDLFEQVIQDRESATGDVPSMRNLYEYIVRELVKDKDVSAKYAVKFAKSKVFYEYETVSFMIWGNTLMLKKVIEFCSDDKLNADDYMPFIENLLLNRDRADLEQILPITYALEMIKQGTENNTYDSKQVRAGTKLAALLLSACTPETMHQFNKKLDLTLLAHLSLHSKATSRLNLHRAFDHVLKQGAVLSDFKILPKYDLNALYLPVILNDLVLLQMFIKNLSAQDLQNKQDNLKNFLAFESLAFGSVLSSAVANGKMLDEELQKMTDYLAGRSAAHISPKTNKASVLMFSDNKSANASNNVYPVRDIYGNRLGTLIMKDSATKPINLTQDDANCLLAPIDCQKLSREQLEDMLRRYRNLRTENVLIVDSLQNTMRAYGLLPAASLLEPKTIPADDVKPAEPAAKPEAQSADAQRAKGLVPIV